MQVFVRGICLPVSASWDLTPRSSPLPAKTPPQRHGRELQRKPPSCRIAGTCETSPSAGNVYPREAILRITGLSRPA